MSVKIETLKRGNEEIAPRTKTSAITDNNGTDLDTLLNNKVDKVTSKGLSTNDYDNTEKGLVASALQPNDNVSLLTNDAGYLTQHQSLANYYNKSETNNLLNAKESLSNKVTSWQSTPDNAHYPSELLVKTEADNIRAVAEGKTKSYIINAQSDITGTKGSDDNYTNVTAITGVTLADLKLGDIILIKALDVPDYWVSQISPSVSLNKLETTKIDLTNYYTKTETDTAISSHHDSTKENSSNKVTSISSSSTNTQYPSAKCVYDLVGNVESLLEAL